MAIAPEDSNQMIIRLANVEDAEQIATLCQQLGYPTSQAIVEQRLSQIQQDEHHAVYVAQHSDGKVIGWIHVYVCQLLLADLQAVIGGLIVNEGDRRSGTGRLLIQQAEKWASASGCQNILVHSNIVRQAAHDFYEKIGYSKIKTSLVFQKLL